MEVSSLAWMRCKYMSMNWSVELLKRDVCLFKYQKYQIPESMTFPLIWWRARYSHSSLLLCILISCITHFVFPISQCKSICTQATRQSHSVAVTNNYRHTAWPRTHLKHGGVTEERRKKQHWEALQCFILVWTKYKFLYDCSSDD